MHFLEQLRSPKLLRGWHCSSTRDPDQQVRACMCVITVKKSSTTSLCQYARRSVAQNFKLVRRKGWKKGTRRGEEGRDGRQSGEKK